MTYIRTANGFVRSNITEGEADLLKPIDYSDPQVIKNIMEQKERARRANEAFIAKHGRKAYEKMMSSNPEWERMDAKIEPSTQEFLEDIFNNEGIAPVEIPEEKKDLSWTRRYKFMHRPCVGCPDCRHWDYRKCECTNPAPNAEICDSISDRYREKGE